MPHFFECYVCRQKKILSAFFAGDSKYGIFLESELLGYENENQTQSKTETQEMRSEEIARQMHEQGGCH